jgi:hypothetical protein
MAVGTFAAAVAYLFCAWAVLFQMRIGPVAMTLDAKAGHGVHAGDMLAFPLVGLAVAMFVFGVVSLDRALRPRSSTPWRVPAPAAVLVAAPAVARVIRVPAAVPVRRSVRVGVLATAS